MKEVTDPALLQALNGGPKEVTDPALLRQLEGGDDRPGYVRMAETGLKNRTSPIGGAIEALKGGGELALQMGSGLAAAVPAIGYGLHNVMQGRPYAEGFHAAQEAGTYEPRSEAGKAASEAVADIFDAYSRKAVDPTADAAARAWGPMAGTVVKTLGEGIPLVAPFAPRMYRAARGTPKPALEGPRTEPTVESPPAPPPQAPAPEVATEAPPAAPREAPQRYRYSGAERADVPIEREPGTEPRPPAEPPAEAAVDNQAARARLEELGEEGRSMTPEVMREAVDLLGEEEFRSRVRNHVEQLAEDGVELTGEEFAAEVEGVARRTVEEVRPFELKGQTNSEIFEQAKRADEARIAEQEAQLEAEYQRQADAETGSFELTGSDRAADRLGGRQPDLEFTPEARAEIERLVPQETKARLDEAEKYRRIEKGFAENRAVLGNFKKGDKVRFMQKGQFTQEDGSVREGREVNGEVVRIADKDQGTLHVREDGRGSEWNVHARNLEKTGGAESKPKKVARKTAEGKRVVEDVAPEPPARAATESQPFPEGAEVVVRDVASKDRDIRRYRGRKAVVEGYGGDGVYLKFEGEAAGHDWPLDQFKLEAAPEAGRGQTLTQTIRKMGGIDKAEILDITGEKRTGKGTKGIPPGLFKKGGRSLDDLATMLREERGFDLDVEAVDGGVQQLRDMIRDEIDGRRQHYSARDEAGFAEAARSKGGFNAYSGIPVEEIAHTAKAAWRIAKDALGIKEKGVEVLPRESKNAPGVMSMFQSPSELAKKYPRLGKIVEWGRQTPLTQDTIRDAFNRRLGEIDKVLGGGFAKVKDFGKRHRANKRIFNEISLEGDMVGKRFTPEELRARGATPEIERAYSLLRSAYDHAFGIANGVRELRGKIPVNYRQGYIPHFFHNFFIKADGKMLPSAKTLREAVAMANQAKRLGYNEITIIPKQFEFPGEGVQAAVIGDAAFFRLKGELQKTFEMSPTEAAEVLDGIVRLRGRSRFMGNFLQRKGSPGWEQNLDWAHRHYFNMIARYAALEKFKSKAISYYERAYDRSFDKEASGEARYAKNYINDLNGNPTLIEELLNTSLENTKFGDFLGKYMGDRPALQVAGMTTNAVAIAKLGLYNASAAMVNLSQAMMAHALLGPKAYGHGIARAANVTRTLFGRRVGVDTATNPDIGIIRQLDIPVQQGLESGSGYSKAAQMGRLFQASTFLFSKVEFELRAAAGLGAYYKGLSEGMSKADALAYGREVNRRANFDYSVADAPDIIRRGGPLTQVMLQFKKFPIKTLEFMGNLKGAEHPRFWIPFALVAGYYAFPGIEALNNMVRGVFGVDMELEMKNYLMNWAGKDPEKKRIARTIMYGIGANFDVDLSHRIGGGDFIPSEVADIFGPAFSSIVRAGQMAAHGDWAETLRAISTAPGNLAIALRNDGEITSPWERDRRLVKLTPGEQALKAAGFSTVAESEQRDASRIMRYNARQQRERETEAIDAFIRAFQNNDEKALKKAIDRMVELEMGATTGKRIAEELQKKGMDRGERAFRNLGRKDQMRNLGLLDYLQE